MIDKESILNWFKDFLQKEVVKKVLGSAAGGLKLFLLITLFNYLWRKFLGPSLRFLYRKAKYYFKKKQYEKKAEKLEKAENEKDYDNAVDDLP